MGISYTQLVPFSELSPGQAGSIRNQIIQALVADCAARTNLPEDRLVVRDIRVKDDLVVYTAGTDADVEDWGCITGAALGYETMTTGTMGDMRWCGIYGVKIGPSCACTALKFNIGGGDRVIWQLQSLRSEDDYVGICPTGVTIPQNTIYTISRYVTLVTSQAFIALKGVIVEPRGKVVSP